MAQPNVISLVSVSEGLELVLRASLGIDDAGWECGGDCAGVA